MAYLSEKQKKVLEIFADTIIPPSEKIPFKPSELKIADYIEEKVLSCSSSSVLKVFRLILNYIQIRARFYRFGLKSFTQMTLTQRESFLKSLYHSPWVYRRMMFRFIEANVLASYYAQKEVSEKIGYQAKLPQKAPSQILYSPQVKISLERDQEIEADVCIIGSGAGGAPVAAELAAQGLRVVILEEGGRYDLNDFKGDPSQRAIKMYRDFGLTATLGTPIIPLMTGKTIGGTTTVNSGTCFRTPEIVFEKWRKEYGLSDLSSDVLSPYFDKVEKIIHVSDVPEELLDPSAKIFREGLNRLGMKGLPLKRNAKSCEGSSLCCFGCPTDAKQSVQLNYIPFAIEHGAELYSFCRVDKIEHSQGKVTQVIASALDPITQKTKACLKVKAKVFVAALGTLQTPILFKASQMAKQSKALGRNLSLHPAGKALALFDQKVTGWQGVPQSFYCPDYKDQGIMFEGVFMPPSVNALSLLVRGKEHKAVMDQFDHVAAFGFLISDESKGRVMRAPNGDRLIFYSMNKNDHKKFVDAVAVLCKVFLEVGAKKIYLPFHSMPVLNSASELSKINPANIKTKDLEALSFHPLGTCCMGVDKKSSVINSYGLVHDMDNLFVSDGSIFPSSLGVNPQVSIMAFATRTAGHIKKNYF